MKHFFIFALFFCMLAAPSFAQPEITCPNPTHEFGKRLISESVDHEFTIRNEGDAPLVLKGFKYTCGCTVASIDDEVVAPGEATIVHGHLNFMGTGAVSKKLLLLTNDPVTPQFPLYFTGESLPIIVIEPERKNLGDVYDDSVFLEPIFLSAGAETVTFHPLENITSTVDWLGFNIVEEEAGKRYKIQPELTRRPDAGMVTLRINIPTDHPDMPSATVVYSANIIGDYHVWPDRLRYVRNENALFSKTVEFSISEGRLGKFSIEEAIPPREDIKIEVTPNEDNTRYYITVQNFPVTDFSLSGKEIIFKTNLDTPIRVPIQAIAP